MKHQLQSTSSRLDRQPLQEVLAAQPIDPTTESLLVVDMEDPTHRTLKLLLEVSSGTYPARRLISVNE